MSVLYPHVSVGQYNTDRDGKGGQIEKWNSNEMWMGHYARTENKTNEIIEETNLFSTSDK